MRRHVSVCVAAILIAAGVCAAVGAEGGLPGTIKGDLPPAQYNRIIRPIEAKLALAEKAMAAYEKEMSKPVQKRSATALTSAKEKASAAYYQAALAARKAGKRVKKPEHKGEIKATYEDPNLSKATAILLGFATEAQQKGDIRKAVAYYKRVLAMDPNNPQAKGALKQIASTVMKATGRQQKERGKKADEKKSRWKSSGKHY